MNWEKIGVKYGKKYIKFLFGLHTKSKIYLIVLVGTFIILIPSLFFINMQLSKWPDILFAYSVGFIFCRMVDFLIDKNILPGGGSK